MTTNDIIVKHAKHIFSRLPEWEADAEYSAMVEQDTTVYGDMMVMEIGHALKNFVGEYILKGEA